MDYTCASAKVCSSTSRASSRLLSGSIAAQTQWRERSRPSTVMPIGPNIFLSHPAVVATARIGAVMLVRGHLVRATIRRYHQGRWGGRWLIDMRLGITHRPRREAVCSSQQKRGDFYGTRLVAAKRVTTSFI